MRYCGSIRLVSLFEIRLSGSRFPPCFWLMAFTPKPRRRVFPWIASLSLLISIVIQSAHVGLIEVLFVLGLEIVADVGDVEARSCALRDQYMRYRSLTPL